MRLRFEYNWILDFSESVEDQCFSMLCLPRDTERQRVLETRTEVRPDTRILRDADGLGNPMLYGAVRDPHASFQLRTEGLVETKPALYEEWQDPADPALYLYRVPSAFTAPGPALEAAFRELEKDAPEDAYGKLLHYTKGVHSLLRYEPGRTGVRTTAEEAVTIGAGVCQDYAHALIALLRMAGLPARYVVGLMRGEGESHAWAEANCKGWWYGVDPTNSLLIDESYIKFSHGRDYGDCMISRGLFRNPRATQTMKVSVSVAPEEGAR